MSVSHLVQNYKFAVMTIADKTGIETIARPLIKRGYAIIATQGTYRVLERHNIEARHMIELTGYPESGDGSIKTLHWKLHAGLQVDRTPEALHEAQPLGVLPVDFLVAGPHELPKLMAELRQQFPNDEMDFWHCLRFADVGGPAALESAAKNFWSVTIASHHDDYPQIVAELEQYGKTTLALRRELACRALERMADYIFRLARAIKDSPDMPEKRPIPVLLHR